MYVKAALQGLDALPADLTLRAQLNNQYAEEGLAPLVERLSKLDPSHVQAMDTVHPQRVIRALEWSQASPFPASTQVWSSTGPGTWFLWDWTPTAPNSGNASPSGRTP